MAIPNDAAQITVSGTAQGTETFSFGWWIDDSAHTAGPLLDLNTDWQTFRDTLLGCMFTDQIITKYTYRRYSGGVVVDQQEDDVNHPGTGSGTLPLQIATVLTLRTATLSRRGRGRIYLPTCAAAMMAGDSHLFGTTRVNNLVNQFAQYATSLSGVAPMQVVSRTASNMHPVTSVDADYVPDTQRRRRDQLATSRHSADVV